VSQTVSLDNSAQKFNATLAYRREVEQRLGKLLCDSQNGNSENYSLFLIETKTLLERYVKAHWYDKSSVEDVVQNILFSLHKCRHSYDPALPFYPWLFSIAKCRLIDELRKVQKYKRLRLKISEQLEDFLSITLQGTNSIEKNFESSQKSEFLLAAEAALEKIPKRQKQAVVLLKAEDRSVKEGSQLMGVSEGAFKVLAHRGYNALRKVWKGGAE
jgi:RNA polymerase sigma factor (sigma-70 family)